jgi:8-amino-7-oxononanoate synthase
MQHEQWITGQLDERKQTRLFREAICRGDVGGAARDPGATGLNFCSNDYLDLARNAECTAASQKFTDRYGHGATASRLVCGTLPYHQQLESRLTAFKGYPASLLFGSGYLANLGVITALVEKGDAVFADRLVHASMIDGMRLSGARIFRFRHNDAVHLDELLQKNGGYRRRLVITESVFSMDGDLAPLPALADTCEKHGAMFMVDEAHAVGVFGPQGRGLVSEYGLQERVNISLGTLSKALGSYGGFVCCSDEMRSYLCNHARPFIYSTALPGTVVGPAIAALDILERDAGEPQRILERATLLRKRLEEAGIDCGNSESPIIPLMVGEAETANRIAKELEAVDILCISIRPPTVPIGTSRLRMTVTLAHSNAHIERAATAVIDAFQKAGLVS